MKRIYTILVLLFITGSLHAQQSSFFSVDPQTKDIVVVGEIPISGDVDQTCLRIKSWAMTISQTVTVTENEYGKTVNAVAAVQTKSAYNPFAGSFTERLNFTFDAMVEEGIVKYQFTNFTLTKTYSGFGTNQKTTTLFDVIDQLDMARKELERAENSTDMSRKAKKNLISQSNDIIEDNTVSLSKSEQVLQKLIDGLESRLR